MKKVLVSLFLLTLLAAPSVAFAQFQLFPGENAGANDYRIYIQNFYRFSIAAGILIATVLIMVGGIMWVTSAGDRGRVEKAMDYIKDSIIGVVLLIGAYTILSLINPNLVNLPAITFPKLSVKTGACLVSQTASTKTGETTGRRCVTSVADQCKDMKGDFGGEGLTCEQVCPKKDENGFCLKSDSQVATDNRNKFEQDVRVCESGTVRVVGRTWHSNADVRGLCNDECLKLLTANHCVYKSITVSSDQSGSGVTETYYNCACQYQR